MTKRACRQHNSNKGILKENDLDVNIKCNKCLTNSKVAVWKCICERYWHRCLSHREAAVTPELLSTKLKTRKQIPQTADNRKKVRLTTQVGPDSHEWLLMQDLAKEKRKREAVDEWDEQPVIELGCPVNRPLRPALYGPLLKRRFLDEPNSSSSTETVELQA